VFQNLRFAFLSDETGRQTGGRTNGWTDDGTISVVFFLNYVKFCCVLGLKCFLYVGPSGFYVMFPTAHWLDRSNVTIYCSL
jgi:hypothetical protein